MITRFTLAAVALVGIFGGSAGPAAAVELGYVADTDFPFEGPFGTYDRMQLQRGLQVYTELCSACHGLKYVAFRSLADETGVALPEEQVRAYAAFYEVFDEELADFRPAIPTDHFPSSSLENAPDLSLMAKARAGFHGPYGLGLAQLFRGMGGPEYIVGILTGYTGETREEAGVLLYENTAFPGGWIAMPPPLSGDDVAFADGAPTDLQSISKDVAAFLMWAAEPKLAERKQVGFIAVFVLTLLAVLLYLTNKRIWAPIKRQAKDRPAE